MDAIGVAQNSETSLRRQAAKSRFYSVGNRYHLVGSIVALGLALVSPVVLIKCPETGPLLGAVAGAWIFVSRLVTEPLRQRYQTKGALAQELFDCHVLGLTWNDSLGRQLSEEEIRRASKKVDKAKSVERHKDWYPAQEKTSWPRSVIVCQRSNAVWARRQHSAYGFTLVGIAVAWGCFGAGVALNEQATLAQYLTTIALPSLPAVLDAIELAKRHWSASARRLILEDETNKLFSSPPVDIDALREVQDQLFALRREAPSVASWFYKIIRSGYEEDMKYAAKQRAD